MGQVAQSARHRIARRLLPFLFILLSPKLFNLLGAVLSGRVTDTNSQAQIVSLLVMVLIPQALCAVAAVQFVLIRASRRTLSRGAGGSDPINAFRRLVQTRRQSYQKYNWAKLGIVPLAFMGAVVTFFILTIVFAAVAETYLSVPREARLNVNIFQEFSKAHPTRTLMRMLFELVSFFAVAAATVWWTRFAWRRIRRRATQVLEDPSYRPIVFLRSFRDENVRVATKTPLWSLIRARVRLEEVIAGQVLQLGPCVAIVMPGERAPKLGAMRAYFADANWQTAIRIWTDRALLSVVMVGDSPSVLWELEHLVWSNRASSLLMVLPPDPSPEARAKRWQAVRKVFAGTRWQHGVVTADVTNALCVIVEPHGTVVSIKGWPRHQIDYEIAVQTAVARLLAPTTDTSQAA